MKIIYSFLLLWAAFPLYGQQTISVIYEGQEQLEKSVREAIEASGYSPVASLDAYTLTLQGGTSVFALDSIKFESVEEEYFTKHLSREETVKKYNQKSYTFKNSSFGSSNCFGGKIDYINDVEIDRSKTKKILGFPCFLATYEYKGTTFSAWFTEELPFPDGPIGLNTQSEVALPLLPGLILSLTDQRTGSYFEAKDITVSVGSTPLKAGDCSDLKDISSYDKLSYWELLKKNSITLTAQDIELNKWYATKPL